MRKRIPCKVIRSVTLGNNEDNPQSLSSSKTARDQSGQIAWFTYTARLAVTRTDMEDRVGTRFLDFCV